MDRKRRVKRSYLRTALLAAVAAGMVFALCGCTTYNSFRQTYITGSDPDKQSVPTITIGVIEPQTGRYADKGKSELKGIELANSIYNNVDGYKVELVKIDTQSSVSATNTAIQGLLEMNPVAIIGTAGDASSLAISDYVDEAGVPAITPSATNPLITQGSHYYFRACMTDSQMGEGLAEYACKKLGAKGIGVITVKNDTSTSALLDGFYDRIKELRGKRDRTVKTKTEIQPEEKEMKDALRQVRSSGADVCFVSMGPEEMDTFFALAEKMKMTDVTYLGTRNWGDAAFVSMMKKHKKIKVVFPYESVLSKTDDTSDTATEEAQRFQIEYANRYGVDDVPTDNAALGYDSYLLVINAIHNSKVINAMNSDDPPEISQIRAEVRNALRGIRDLKCATGVFNFDDTGNVVRAVTLSTIKGGKPVTEYVTAGETEARKLEDIEDAESGNADSEKRSPAGNEDNRVNSEDTENTEDSGEEG